MRADIVRRALACRGFRGSQRICSVHRREHPQTNLVVIRQDRALDFDVRPLPAAAAAQGEQLVRQQDLPGAVFGRDPALVQGPAHEFRHIGGVFRRAADQREDVVPVPLLILKRDRRRAEHILPLLAEGRRLVLDIAEQFVHAARLAAAAVEGGLELTLAEFFFLPVLHLAQISGVEEQAVALAEPQRFRAVGDALICAERRVDRRLEPFIALLAAHQEGNRAAGVHEAEAAVHRVQNADEDIDGVHPAQIVQLGVDVGHGLHQRTAHAEAAADGRLRHNGEQRLRDPAARDLPYDEAKRFLIQKEIIIKVAVPARPLLESAGKGEGHACRPGEGLETPSGH